LIKFAKRLDAQKNVHWAIVRQLLTEKAEDGRPVIQLSSGDPDIPTPPHIVETLRESVLDPTYHRYPFSFQTELHQAVAAWYDGRFGVTLDPATEVRVTAGSQAAIGDVGLALLEPGDIALVTDPAYGSYVRATEFAGAEVYYLPIAEETGYLPDLTQVPTAVLAKTRVLWLNYPQNPTGAIAPLSFFADVVSFAKKYDILVIHDIAYGDITYDGYVAPSFLAVAGAKDVGIEINTLSKSHNMAGWRVGTAVGNAEIIRALHMVGSNNTMGLFGPVQLAAVEALTSDQSWIAERNLIYQRRRDIVVDGLRRAGLSPAVPKATLYVWARLPEGYDDSFAFSKMVLEQTDVWITSGNFFGEGGNGYIRVTLTVPDETLQEAMDRLQSLKL
jgi:LL-diaminopimelate aminotransferase